MHPTVIVSITNERDRKGERGAALIMVLFASLLILAGALMLLLTTTISATNAIGATDEMKAYYAAEAGLRMRSMFCEAMLRPIRTMAPKSISRMLSTSVRLTIRAQAYHN